MFEGQSRRLGDVRQLHPVRAALLNESLRSNGQRARRGERERYNQWDCHAQHLRPINE
jgi:hypothetical protein